MHLLGLDFEPRIPRLSDRRLYAFEPSKRYGGLAPLFGHRLTRDLIVSHWPDIQRAIGATRDRTVTPSSILKKLSAYRQQNGLAAALREVGRIERTPFTLRRFENPALRRTVTAELNKGEARNSRARAVAFHRLGRLRDRGLENRQTRPATLNLVTAAIILVNCRYLGRAVDEMRRQGTSSDPAMQSRLCRLAGTASISPAITSGLIASISTLTASCRFSLNRYRESVSEMQRGQVQPYTRSHMQLLLI